VFAGAWCGKLFHALITHRAGEPALGAIYREQEAGDLHYGTFRLGADEPIVASVETASFPFSALFNLKRIRCVDVFFDQVTGPVEVWFRWRFDGQGIWNLSKIRRFEGSNSATRLFRIPVAEEQSGAGHYVQFAIQWRGRARLKLAVFSAFVLDRYLGSIEDCGVVPLDPGQDDRDQFQCPEIPGELI